MGNIVAIGGGDLSTLATEPIDREIIALARISRPNALFVPTASDDATEYWDVFDAAYRGAYGCRTDVLSLLGTPPLAGDIARKIRWANIVYVGGGNTLKMMRRWRRLGVDSLLREAHAAGKTLCGVSAGAICWFEKGHSDSMSFYSPDDWNYVAVTGLGLLPGLACPHYDSDTKGIPRREDFHTMLKRRNGGGVAIDNDCALVVADDGFRVFASTPNAGAYALRIERSGRVKETALPIGTDWQPIGALGI